MFSFGNELFGGKEAILEFGEGIIAHGDDEDQVSDGFLVNVYNVIACDNNRINNIITLNEIMTLQERSKVIKELKKRVKNKKQILKTDVSLKEFYRYKEDLLMNNAILVKRMKNDKLCAVIGFKQMVSICVVIHRNMAHIGQGKLTDLMARYVWHPIGHTIIQEVCRTCPTCQLNKVDHRGYIPTNLENPSWQPFRTGCSRCHGYAKNKERKYCLLSGCGP